MEQTDSVKEPDIERNVPEQEKEKPLWNSFKNTPRKPEVGTNANFDQYNFLVKVLKVLTYIVVAFVILFSAVLSKATLLLMTSQLKEDNVRPYCNKNLDVNRKFTVELPVEERVLWIWILIFAYLVPQVGTLIESLWIYLFKKLKMKGVWQQLPVLLLTESPPAVGSAILVFCILPELDVVKAAMLTNAFCLIPGVLGAYYRKSMEYSTLDIYVLRALDIVSILSQFTSLFLWPLIERNVKVCLIPIAAIFISFGWWQNYADKKTEDDEHNTKKEEKDIANETKFLYSIISVTNCLIFFVSTLIIFWIQDGEIDFLFNNFRKAFSDRTITVTEVQNYVEGLSEHGIDDTSQKLIGTTEVQLWTGLTILLINVISSYFCYSFAKFASKVSIQKISFAFPIQLTVPTLLSVIIGLSGEYLKDECAYRNILPEYLFFTLPPFYLLRDFLMQQYAWAWMLWLLSQIWITIHLWKPSTEHLVQSEKLFLKPMYDPFLIDQSICMNRRRDNIEIGGNNSSVIHPTIYVCGTMWQEEREEIMTCMESLMRLDEDWSAYRIAEKRISSDIPNNYNLESHVFFDNAFIWNKDKTVRLLNNFVLTLIKCVEDAAREVHRVKTLTLRPPKLFDTPYGGRIQWILPGRSKLIVHLKDSDKIRRKKRWSQVMYMYYLIGHRLKAKNPEEFKEASKKSFILAIDCDIDFRPEALHLLVEYMKKNENLGAACGRIHPVGTGVLAWYQVFEYAVGHWLQKATEHVIGCVLCSPGCFSLFRMSALAKDGVMAKYTSIAEEAKHRLQYDLGEDRWLCTLILKAGYRIEYAAASDSYTHCPILFKDFYNQRKRWIPSTMANILDVLQDYKYVVKQNNSISMIYIYYQTFLLIGTIIGPGTIFLMLIGATVTVFEMDQWTSFLMNLVPILIFVLVCSTCPPDFQVKAAAILSSIYGLLMMAVLIGVLLQIQEDGLLAPTSIFFLFMIGEFVLAALIHPKEFYCLKYGIIYYVTVPSMYMLLMIYSVFNIHEIKWGTRENNVEQVANENELETTKSGKKENKFKHIINSIFDVREMFTTPKQQNVNQKSPSEDDDVEESSQISSWFEHKDFKNPQILSLDDEEVKFWTSVMDEYLDPKKEGEIPNKLADLRDEMVSSFFMINALFVLVVFILTLKKDLIHIDWPYNASVNFTYVQSENEVELMKEYLHLEPIGFLFLITFGVLLLIQSFGMIFHRFETFCQIIANTHIDFSKKNNEKEEKDLTKYNAVHHTRRMQKLRQDDSQNEEPEIFDLHDSYIANVKKYRRNGGAGIDKEIIEKMHEGIRRTMLFPIRKQSYDFF
ncbi:hypothetical protein WA026_016046 [Henosepilachna vigintioctopunctata]|uniref:chitin synthase n=1 Tax=Henosepilachna vigintioctopunctata TaxID=420089 RepID=A0AAW1U7S8_9CUCU